MIDENFTLCDFDILLMMSDFRIILHKEPDVFKGIKKDINLQTLMELKIGFICLRVRVMVSNAIFSNISVISLQLVLLVEETRVFGENHQPAASH